MPDGWIERHRVRTCDVDFRNRVKAGSIFDFMQEAASNNAAYLGFGYDDMRSRKQFWVLSRAALIIDAAVGFGEEIIVETWPKAVEKLFALRDFMFYDAAKKVIGRATTAWLMMNADTLRPVSPETIRHGVTFLDKPPAIVEVPGKLPVFSELTYAFEKRIGYNDIDINNHVNNVRYLEFALDCLPEEIWRNKSLSSLRINFQKEMKYGDTIRLFFTETDAGLFAVEGRNQHGIQVFRSLLQWK
jgi:medium-chain acyl-[acyl-carrier-protein] hydrolase